MPPDEPPMEPNIVTFLDDAKQAFRRALRDIARMATEHPETARHIISTVTMLLERWCTSPTYRKAWNFYEMWKYRDEQQFFEVDEFGLDPAMIKLVEPLMQFLYHHYFRVDVEGAANMAIGGPALLVANHSGSIAYDGAITNIAVMNNHPQRRYARYLVDDFVYNLPFIGTFIQRTGGVRACHENATKLIEHGHMIMVFPEGIKGISKLYENRYRLERFGRGGYVRLAMRTGVPIIPTAIIGAEEIHPLIWKSVKLGKLLGLPFFPFTPTFPWLGPFGAIPLPTKWRIIFGRPVPFSRYKPRDAENPKLVGKLSERIRGEIQRMIDDALKKRVSLWY